MVIFGIPYPLQTFNPESHPEFWPSNKRQIPDPENHIGDPMRSSCPQFTEVGKGERTGYDKHLEQHFHRPV